VENLVEGPRGPGSPPLILGKKEEMTEGRKGQVKQNWGPSLSSRSGSATAVLLPFGIAVTLLLHVVLILQSNTSLSGQFASSHNLINICSSAMGGHCDSEQQVVLISFKKREKFRFD